MGGGNVSEMPQIDKTYATTCEQICWGQLWGAHCIILIGN